MQVLVISARFPEHGYGHPTARIRGDQARGFAYIAHLAQRHRVTVVTAAPASSRAATAELKEMASVRVCSVRRPHRAASAARWMITGRPAQVGWTLPARAWRVAREEAAASDVALALTVRSVGGPLPCPLVVDHIDALSRNLSYRASGREALPIRLFARLEARLLRRWEASVAQFAAAQIAASADDAAVLPRAPAVAVLPVSWRGAVFRDPPGHQRDYDIILSGDMRYPPNREAVAMLIDEILPRVRRRRPDTTAIVVGRAADSLSLEGVAVASDVPDMLAYLRRARVAVVPLMNPAGSPYKAIEAAASGAALVSTPWALDCFGFPGRRASTVDEFANEIVSLLEDEGLRRRLTAETLSVVEEHLTESIGRRLEALLFETAERQPASGAVSDSAPTGTQRDTSQPS